MSVDANALERDTLERKDRDELQKIVGALGGRATTRTRKADLIDQILELTGVTPASGSDDQDRQPEAEADAPVADAAPDDRTDAEDAGDGDGDGDEPAEEPAPPKARTGVAARRASGAASGERPKQAGPGGTQDRKQGSGQDRDQDRGGQDQDAGDQAGRDEAGDDTDAGGKRRRRRGRNRDGAPGQEEYSGDPVPVVGVLDLRDDGYGFLRVDGLLPSKDDCYVSVKQVRQFGLRKGDVVAGGSRPAFRNEKNPAILQIDTVNDVALDPGAERPSFEDLTAVFPTERIVLTLDDEADDRTTRAIDLLAPIGKGSRALLLAPPRSGATTMLQAVARSVEVNEPDATLVVVLARRAPRGDHRHGAPRSPPAPSTAPPSTSRRMSTSPCSSWPWPGPSAWPRPATTSSSSSTASPAWLAPPTRRRPAPAARWVASTSAAVHAAKRCFGTGRKLEEGGSVTIVATAKVDTGSDVDAAVVDAVMGAATTHIRLDRHAAERRAFPAIDVGATGTRHEERLVGDDGAEARDALRRSLGELPADAAERSQ